MTTFNFIITPFIFSSLSLQIGGTAEYIITKPNLFTSHMERLFKVFLLAILLEYTSI